MFETPLHKNVPDKIKETGLLLVEDYDYVICGKTNTIKYKLITAESYKKVNYKLTSKYFTAYEFYTFLDSWYIKEYPDEKIRYDRYKKLKIIEKM